MCRHSPPPPSFFVFAGCAFCHHQASLLLKQKPTLDQMGVNLVAVGNGTKLFAEMFVRDLGWTGEVYLDAESSGERFFVSFLMSRSSLPSPTQSKTHHLRALHTTNPTTAYKALGCQRLSAWKAAKRYFFDSKAVAFYKTASKEYAGSNTTGDGQQTGGVWVLGPGNAQPLYEFMEADHRPDVFADEQAILEACARKDTKEEPHQPEVAR